MSRKAKIRKAVVVAVEAVCVALMFILPMYCAGLVCAMVGVG